jgi:hypothetical protein
MPYLYLLLGLSLLALWLIALAVGGVQEWFLWLTFAVSVVAVALALDRIGARRRLARAR